MTESTFLEEIREKGYTTIFDPEIAEYISKLNLNVEEVAKKSKEGDIFLCEYGIKQIQNLQDRLIFIGLALGLKNLIGKSDAKVLNMQYFIKYPNYKITSPHQDGFYFEAPDKEILTFWIPLMDVTPENSCLFYVPKSHLGGVLPHEAVGTKLRTRTGKTGYSQYCQIYKDEEFEPVPLRAGEIVVHDQFAVHYSSENHSDQRRIAVTCIMEIGNIKKEPKPKKEKFYVYINTTHTRRVPAGGSGFYDERWSWEAYDENYLISEIVKHNFKSKEAAQEFIDKYLKEHPLEKRQEIRIGYQSIMKTQLDYQNYISRCEREKLQKEFSKEKK